MPNDHTKHKHAHKPDTHPDGSIDQDAAADILENYAKALREKKAKLVGYSDPLPVPGTKISAKTFLLEE